MVRETAEIETPASSATSFAVTRRSAPAAPRADFVGLAVAITSRCSHRMEVPESALRATGNAAAIAIVADLAMTLSASACTLRGEMVGSKVVSRYNLFRKMISSLWGTRHNMLEIKALRRENGRVLHRDSAPEERFQVALD